MLVFPAVRAAPRRARARRALGSLLIGALAQLPGAALPGAAHPAAAFPAPASLAPASSPRPGAAEPAWYWPVSPVRISRSFLAPASEFGPGHRGIDLAARPGQPVAAPAAGEVVFVGFVVDRPLVTVRLDSGWRYSIEPLEPLVVLGQRVGRAEPLGTVGSGGHCSDRCLHLGLRDASGYRSPLPLFGLPPRLRLLPWDD